MTEKTEPRLFGTFLGVFTPSILTILGVMMYLRFGWVLGNAGLAVTLLIVLMASSITFITGLSASAIATNMKVGVGGEYFMISRSLGLEVGGAIGIPLFLCRTLSLTLYSFGLAESMIFMWPASFGAAPPLQVIAAIMIIITTAIAGKSAELSLKLQIPIMVAVGASILALAIGVFSAELKTPELTTHYDRSAPLGFWYIFAVFFPAVTGFTAGIGMSGDLKDPQKSIPTGTILAVCGGTLTYLIIVVLLGITTRVTPEQLAVIDPQAPPIWTKIAFLGFWLVYPGMWGAILSSAFGSALGGPRVLQALAADGLVPKILSKTSKSGQPTIATWTTGLIALIAVALGDLNEVGRWVTIFFLTLYVTINLSATIESLVGDPSYRPTIRLPWIISLTGSLGAVLMMFLISPVACIVAICTELVLFVYLRGRALETRWGDVRAGMWSALARFSLIKLRSVTMRARNWRPHILLFTANPTYRMELVRMANWFNQNRGVVTVCQVIVDDINTSQHDLPAIQKEMDDSITDQGMVAFCEVDLVSDFEIGITGILQANGYAGLQSNTVMFGWPQEPENLARMFRIMRVAEKLRMSTIFSRLKGFSLKENKQSIDVWWRGKQQNGDLMLLLAYLLNQNEAWITAEISIRTIVESEEEGENIRENLKALVDDARIKANTHVIIRPSGKRIAEIMHEASRNADVVLLGLNMPEPGEELVYAERLFVLASGFKAPIFVRNGGRFVGELV